MKNSDPPSPSASPVRWTAALLAQYLFAGTAQRRGLPALRAEISQPALAARRGLLSRRTYGAGRGSLWSALCGKPGRSSGTRCRTQHRELIGPMDYTMHASPAFRCFPYLVRLQPGWEDILQLNADEVAEVFTIPLSYLRYNRPKTVRVERELSHHRRSARGRSGADRMPAARVLPPVLFWDYEGQTALGHDRPNHRVADPLAGTAETRFPYKLVRSRRRTISH